MTWSCRTILKPWQRKLTPIFLCHYLKGLSNLFLYDYSHSTSLMNYFSLICSFMEYSATVWDTYQQYNSEKTEKGATSICKVHEMQVWMPLKFSYILDEFGWPRLSQRRKETRLILVVVCFLDNWVINYSHQINLALIFENCVVIMTAEMRNDIFLRCNNVSIFCRNLLGNYAEGMHANLKEN